ncbi:SRPBCC family protein [Rhizobium sp. CAU 1783]
MFQSFHQDQRHTIHLPGTPKHCFGFFTPEGERLWVDDWSPAYFHRTTAGSLEGTVFSTGHGGEATIWIVADHDPDDHRIRYSRISPGVRAVLVDVHCRPEEDGTSVEIRYRSTGLSPTGNAVIEAMSGPAFPAMIEAWKHRILPLL